MDSAPATVSITVNPVNDAPKLQNIEAGALDYTENDAATPITATTTVTDDSPNFDTGTLTVDYSGGRPAPRTGSRSATRALAPARSASRAPT